MTELSGGTRFLKPSDRGGKFRQAIAHGNKAITDRSATWGFSERADPLTIPPRRTRASVSPRTRREGRSAEHNQDTESEAVGGGTRGWRDEYRNRPAKVFGGIATLWPCRQSSKHPEARKATPVNLPRQLVSTRS